jgi:hypothetical protein
MMGHPIKSPRIERIAYQIHWLIQETGGDCTLEDMAELTGESMQRCAGVARSRGWGTDYRRTSASRESWFGTVDMRVRTDRDLTALEAMA